MTIKDPRTAVSATGAIEIGEGGQHLGHRRMAVAVS
jgi:hypothetical protein